MLEFRRSTRVDGEDEEGDGEDDTFYDFLLVCSFFSLYTSDWIFLLLSDIGRPSCLSLTRIEKSAVGVMERELVQLDKNESRPSSSPFSLPSIHLEQLHRPIKKRRSNTLVLKRLRTNRTNQRNENQKRSRTNSNQNYPLVSSLHPFSTSSP